MTGALDYKVALLVLGAALLHACWNALVKADKDRLLTVATVSGVALVLCGSALPFLPLPAAASRPYLFWGVVTHNGFKIFLLLAYRGGDLSRVYPLARGAAPLLVAAFSGAVAGERLDGAELAGVLLISLGLASLTFEYGLPARRDWPSLGYAFLTGVFIASYTLIDGLGVRQAGQGPLAPWAYTAWLFFLDGMPMIALALALRARSVRHYFRRGVLPGIAAGTLSLIAYFVVLWALRLGAMAPIAALRETGVIFAAAIGTLVLGEPFGRRRVIAAVLVAAGVGLIGVG